uniref:hypothetical protein n=1 Tax=Acinetobacter baumannii TaxID=470 RepID=UPI001C0712A8
VKLCRSGYDKIYDELFKYHHKRKFYGKIRDEILPIAWHPDRYWNWCLDEEEKERAKKMWC